MTTSNTHTIHEDEVYELRASFAQQRMWVLDQFSPGNPFYNMPNAVRLQGKLDLDALTDTINEMIYRHETLRTSFEMLEDGLKQLVNAELVVEIPITDLQYLPLEERFPKAQELAKEEFARPFLIKQAPLVRTRLLRLAADDHMLLITMHHIISDGWSMGVFFTELAAIYEAFAKGQPSPLPDLTIQYADFSEWQFNYLTGDVLEKQLSYWKNTLGGSMPILQLPTDKQRPVVQSYRGTVYKHMLSGDLLKKLQDFNQQERVTMFMTMLAAFNVLLARWTGQEDIWVGTPIAGRNVNGIEKLIGLFVNTLVMRADLSENVSFRDLLQRVQKDALDAFEHQDFPFEKLVEELQPERNRTYSPLFQVFFAMQNTPREEVHLQDVTLSTVPHESGTAKFDLSLFCSELPDGLLCGFEYCTDLFEESTIARMAEHFTHLVSSLLDNPDTPVYDLQMLTDAEQQLFKTWNGELPAPADSCVHRLIEEQAARTPDNIAVECERQTLTYRELNARANQLARHLQTLGIGTESLVTLCVERSIDLIVAELGILKAGAAYVPIDPSNPAERTAFILQDTKASVMVTQSHLAQELPAHDARLICLDTDGETLSGYATDNLVTDVTSQNLAYLIYTSGSTGTPKAVAVEHHQLLSTLFAMQKTCGFTADDVMTWVVSVAFDVSLFEVMNPLLIGARVKVLTRAHITNLELLTEELQEVTTMHAVPSLMRQIVDAGRKAKENGANFDKLRQLYSAGDVVSPQLLKDMNEVFHNAESYVLYGPTETSIFATEYLAKRGQEGEKYTIGTRCANAQLYVCDRFGKEVPLGVPGELHIAGLGVTRGYYGREELTAEKFITVNGERRYKSGDLVRFLPDGNIEFFGRMDGQVKIRGFRVEIGEIETVLVRHEQVKEAVLTVFEHQGEKNLAAYLVAEPGQTPDEALLRDFLKQTLPEYMVPAVFVTLQEFPLNANGKIDRKALPAPGGVLTSANRPYIKPRTELEEQVAAMFGELLGIEQVGAADNFFERGGHSLLATMFVSRVKEAHKIEYSLGDLFEVATVEGIAAKIESRKGTAVSDGGAGMIKRIDRSRPMGGR
ncbi:hypothetical protein CIG75_10460 [Tumebacillus algifaecis]|uniref:Carrier domain-containing protein n=1 Tax=Tumebacillus algifaecis TaxID=1214604 RepID=A0A223D1E7_9BACL|nr:non-ribosomal peptide synthetase [Tumebacillus algifaecis]ASS75371.1 hypothetical protein CIG75_10460 [Tumebacillus algifaecis]